MYSFEKSVRKPIYTQIIDDEWRNERLQDLDIVIGANVLTQDIKENFERDAARAPTNDIKDWNDLGLEELISKYTDPEESKN
eukprot:CAMPEP_0205824912 /NCGR_PEP_ID=MMETSP0206-20130828/23220_1 /ASSEMBLY_ACC=CAM_ASM_000279 /TAXON_ID=36767 /ORGANISM="Euplotes focardii, Strain TN1" /LENGTH=81 /DNA_ID=CAMNT_0053123471 /DNA_START=36 /DNA_END=281 /DNA_ORIENTATION=-